jgi:hypothetical protein
MKDAIEQGREPIEETSKALAACRQELVEHSRTTSISVNNTGQRIVAHGPPTNETVRGQVN